MSRTLPIIEHSSINSDGFHILAVFTQLGYRCGYVGGPIHEAHPIYGESSLTAHGGITFEGTYDDYELLTSGYYYYGFDCAHYGDGIDLDTLDKYKLPHPDYSPPFIFRSLHYVLTECKSLAHQLTQLELFI